MKAFRPYDPIWICARYKHPCDKVDWALREASVHNTATARLWSALIGLLDASDGPGLPSLGPGLDLDKLAAAKGSAVVAWRGCPPRPEVTYVRVRERDAAYRRACRMARAVRRGAPVVWAAAMAGLSQRAVP